MALYVYTTATGALVSWNPSDSDPVASDAVLAAKGLSKVTGLAVLDATHRWDEATHSVIVVAAMKSEPTQREFWKRFTSAERVALQTVLRTGSVGAQDALRAFKDYIMSAPTVDCNDSYILTTVQTMESVGVIAAGRAAVIVV
jgi:hypothetical protein